MIKIEQTEIYGWETAIRGMRNPMNSWDKSDSEWCLCLPSITETPCETCPFYEDEQDGCTTFCHNAEDVPVFVVGNNDLDLMKRLVKSGTDHSKFMRMVTVTVDVTAPLYWWKEYDTYKVGTVANSCSTMHKIHDKKFEWEDFSTEHLIPRMKDVLDVTIFNLNACRGSYLETKDKMWWYQMIQLLPSSYNQKRTLQLNYAVLRNIYHSRKNHKLDEWHDFCHWAETLPYSELITM